MIKATSTSRWVRGVWDTSHCWRPFPSSSSTATPDTMQYFESFLNTTRVSACTWLFSMVPETSTSHGHHLACAEQLHQLDNLTLEACLLGEKQNKFSQPVLLSQPYKATNSQSRTDIILKSIRITWSPRLVLTTLTNYLWSQMQTAYILKRIRKVCCQTHFQQLNFSDWRK